MNQKLFYNAYHRTISYFQNTPAMAKGMRSSEEIALLKEAGAPEEVWSIPAEDFVDFRAGIKQRRRHALSLLKAAGWTLYNGALRHDKMGAFRLKFLLQSGSALSKMSQFFKRSLESIGVELVMQEVDTPSYTAKLRQFDFQIVVGNASISSAHLGEELLSIYGSKSASDLGSFNLSGIQSPIVDHLIRRILASQKASELFIAARCLDRYLLSQRKNILCWHAPSLNIAVWKKFGYVDEVSYTPSFYDYWWSIFRQSGSARPVSAPARQ